MDHATEPTNETLSRFMEAAREWVCEGYSLDLRYLAGSLEAGYPIWDAVIRLNPLPANSDLQFQLDTGDLSGGHIQSSGDSLERLLDVVQTATLGRIQARERTLTLARNRSYEFSSEMNIRERWFYELHLQVAGNVPPPHIDMSEADNSLRAATPPFDGVADLATWLGFPAPQEGAPHGPRITIRIGPPCDLIFDKCTFKDGRLHLVLHAHPKFDTTRITLAIRTFPNNALDGRRQIASSITWGAAEPNHREGVVDVTLSNADSVLAMLMIGPSTVRRQWFLDPTKAHNLRVSAIQYFDSDLRMIRQALLDLTDASKFERAVAALLFIQGFSPCIQLENDAPDLIVSTPIGRLVLVECTIRVADFASKMGKLVDRRAALAKHLKASGHLSDVAALLACRLPRDQIAAHQSELRAHNIILISGENLVSWLEQARFVSDPDKLLETLQQRAGS
jgi:hypothetical protein